MTIDLVISFTNDRVDGPTPIGLGFALRDATEAAAVAAHHWIGRGRSDDGDGAAVGAMRRALGRLPFRGTVIIGEGEKDAAPQLYNGEIVGHEAAELEVDVAVDPVEGTSYLAKGMTNALAVVAVSRRGTMFDPGPAFYMEKLVVPAPARDAVEPGAPVARNLAHLARAMGKAVSELTVYVLEKPRHRQLVADIHAAGARVALYPAGDVAGAIAAGQPSAGHPTEIDALIGTGGTPEGLLAAAALRALGAQMYGRLDPQLAGERRAVAQAGLSTAEWLDLDALVSTDQAWVAATGITSGLLVDGVSQQGDTVTTQTLVTDGPSRSQHVVTTVAERRPVGGCDGHGRNEEEQP